MVVQLEKFDLPAQNTAFFIQLIQHNAGTQKVQMFLPGRSGRVTIENTDQKLLFLTVSGGCNRHKNKENYPDNRFSVDHS
jgi:hypothetical protein